MAYEEPTLEPIGGDDPRLSTLGLAFYFVFAAVAIYVAAVFSVAAAETVAYAHAGIVDMD